jgi:hypothetical protein
VDPVPDPLLLRKSGSDLEGQGMGLACLITSNILPFALETPFYFDSDRSATRDWYVKINVANENLKRFLAVFKMYHVFVCNLCENTLIS